MFDGLEVIAKIVIKTIVGQNKSGKNNFSIDA